MKATLIKRCLWNCCFLTGLVAVPDKADPQILYDVNGTVYDQRTGASLGGVSISIETQNKRIATDSSGHFLIQHLPAGKHTILLHLIGYTDIRREIFLSTDTVLSFSMQSDPIQLQSLTITDSSGHNDPSYKARAITVSSRNLEEKLGRTVAETIANEPGIAQRTMGPAPARPVLRGLGGNRLLVLEDGEKTGDLSSTSADHAVVIDPIGSTSIEVIRGPAALLFGSNTVGGIINVRRERIPASVPPQISGNISTQSETVNDGLGGDVTVVIPYQNLVATVGTEGRLSGDLRTPNGKLNNTEIHTHSYFVGGGYIRDRFRLGIETSRYVTEYGIPGGFLGGHKNGVTIELERSNIDSYFEYGINHDVIQRFVLRTSYNRYFHRELELEDVCGVGFGVLQYNATAQLMLSPSWLRGGGTLGVWAEYRDYAQTCLTFTPDAIERAAAAYLYKEIYVDSLLFKTAFRFDYRSTSPEAIDTNKTGIIRRRDFQGISASLAMQFPIAKSITMEGTVLRSFNAPGIEELFSEGPHIAAYSYEIGNANLSSESGVSLEWTTRFRREHTKITASFFRNWFDRYIYASNTGEYEYGPGETGRLLRYQYRGRDAHFYGFELSADVQPLKQFSLGGNISFVRGKVADDNSNLPLIPPLQGHVWIGYSPRTSLLTKLRIRAADKQDKLGEFEEPTAGYIVFDLLSQYHFSTKKILHSLILNVENIASTEYRNHLSRVNAVMPEAARNFKLLYRLQF